MNNLRCYTFSVLFLLASVSAVAGTFFTTRDFSCNERSDSMAFAARVDFPLTGNAAAMRSVKRWICDVLDIDTPQTMDESNFENFLRVSCSQYFETGGQSKRKVEISRTYEDNTLVTYESLVEDRDSETWVSADCATFSKIDGHRLTVKEIFKCGEAQIKQLMWQYRGDLPMEVSKPEELVVGDAGYIDGWVVVIGPAYHHTGAEYRIRYEAAQPYLRTGKHGEYYSME
jgi:hypothetical protein